MLSLHGGQQVTPVSEAAGQGWENWGACPRDPRGHRTLLRKYGLRGAHLQIFFSREVKTPPPYMKSPNFVSWCYNNLKNKV